MSLEQIRVAGLEVLARELGAVGMIRFLQQFETGQGDYSKDRHKWLDEQDLETIVMRIQQKPKGSKKAT
ncbi:MAG: hypothetical protein FJZ87_11040 [Chloroflexi bacterium]|nr:hypothetical protein [Chloroflexota bacterium]